MRIARDFGSVSELLPDGIADLRDCPYVLFDAIRHATVVLSWQENLPDKERPPKRIWQDGEALKEWFARLDKEREREREGKKIDDPVDNPAAAGLIVE